MTGLTCCHDPQKDEFLRLVINSIRNDLTSRNEAFHCLALGFVGSGGCASLHLHDPHPDAKGRMYTVYLKY